MTSLPPKFAKLRPLQLEARRAAEEAIANGYSRLAYRLGTGSGKSAFAMSLAASLGCRAVYVVATKQLQNQLMEDFAPMGMVDLRGRANYTCPNYGNCAEGKDNECSLARSLQCPSSAALARAQHSSYVATNYAWWLASSRQGADRLDGDDGVSIDLVIFDEFHEALDQLTGSLSFSIGLSDLSGLAPNAIEDVTGGPVTEELATFFRARADEIIARETAIKRAGSRERRREAGELLDRARRLRKLSGNWIYQSDGGVCEFKPIRVSGYSHILFPERGIALAMSATLSEFGLSLLTGCLEGDTDSAIPLDYQVWPDTFPPENAPVYHIPTCKLTRKSTTGDYRAVVAMMDTIIDGRTDRKGVIDTISYDRARLVRSLSRHAPRMIMNESARDAPRALALFRSNPPRSGSLLISPSFSSGHDFSGDQAEYHILLKYPAANESDILMRERCRQIPGFRAHYSAIQFEQRIGRTRRSATDRTEIFILDNSARQLLSGEVRRFLPPRFKLWILNKPPRAPARAF